ncbi:uncharacterized protein LOC110829398 [Zootermopsis nevadensis]|uniref:A kinase anchor protein 1, mitochondrial n=1 Tax=Zootermopsis nevadensis TaxID=136037 RepID=A0A067RI17_ZOONE|nr:uncharacterized protein LOC110829398 [Zootermopsis nevadensis]XP_021918766.1 uncharacterized protein LOC110829398 [Zootermopsis nevadensis]XP_021918767.1 uncharacterized protein LOC110829398 [Zootermopsis nevadensis]XP_021918768.1 uncharacterized protein LOC110829398 [Zootermopsis nevadensis]XP_021918769.1 uncharacterized protein LOC110829398 [Zootermopsis nevadensis]KDR20045.1 A kinase anchor protein 1, mitochondrial [Zootermopsis nevadensis]
MVPNSSRQLLVWSLPTLAFLLSLLWYHRKRGTSFRSDPGGTTEDTGSTSGDKSQQVEDLQVSITASLPAERQQTGKDLRETVTIVCGDKEIKIDKPKGPAVKEETTLEASHQQSLELVLKERVLTETALSVFTGVPGEVGNCEDSDMNEIDIKKEIQEMSAVEFPVDKLVCVQKIPVKSVMKEEAKIAMLEGSICNGLESPEHLTDKISDTDSSVAQVEKEVHEKLTTSVATNISPQVSSESSQTLPEVHVLATREPLERTAEEQNSVGGVVEALPMNIISSEEISRRLQISDIRIQQDNKDTSVGCEDSEDEAQVLPLNINISDDLKFVESFEKSIDSIQLAIDTKVSSVVEDMEEPEDNESVSSVDSFSVATTIVTRKSSIETLTMEKLAHEEEDSKKSAGEVTVEGSESVPLECTLSSLELNENVKGEASSDADGMSGNGAMAGTFAVVSKHQRTERDSANHSPADVMLASPSISSCSDAQSEGSSDSGKGCSDVATPPSRTPASGSSLSGDAPLPSVYEFVLPQHLVGRLIGRHGCFVHQIKEKTNASIFIKRHPDTQKLKICAVEGTQADIESALEMIRQRFPPKRYPNVSLEQVSFLPPVPTFPLIPETLQLPLVEGVNNDVILSSLVSPAHFFLQQPTHPTFPALIRQDACMNVCYSEPAAPPLPTPIQLTSICVAPAMGGWYRAQVVAVDSETDACDIKFVDYGGYVTVTSSVLRQIRGDFLTLPFQAAECYLANVIPFGGHEAEWSKEAVDSMEELTQGQVLQAQVCGYAEDSMPLVYLYAIHGSQVVLINQELVSQGLAEWVESAEA